MIKRIMAFLAVLAMAATGMVATASAQTDDAELDRIQTISGKGWLAAKGEGNVGLNMGGKLHMRLVGDVVITDLAGDMSFKVRSAPDADSVEEATAQTGTVVTLEDFDGALIVRGSHFTVRANGNVKFVAHGRGKAYLDGTGRFRTRHGDWRPWVTGYIDIQPA